MQKKMMNKNKFSAVELTAITNVRADVFGALATINLHNLTSTYEGRAAGIQAAMLLLVIDDLLTRH